MQFNDEEGDDTYLQRTGNGRGRQQHLKKSEATPPLQDPQVGGAAAARAAAGKAAPRSASERTQSWRNDMYVEPGSPWDEINRVED